MHTNKPQVEWKKNRQLRWIIIINGWGTHYDINCDLSVRLLSYLHTYTFVPHSFCFLRQKFEFCGKTNTKKFQILANKTLQFCRKLCVRTVNCERLMPRHNWLLTHSLAWFFRFRFWLAASILGSSVWLTVKI